MANNLFETQYDLTKKSKLREFYESNKIWIFSTVFVFIIIVASYNYYLSSKAGKKILLSENYIQAKVYLESGSKAKALEILKNITFSNDPTYSTLSFFMILDENLINEREEISKLFDHLLQNNNFDKEIEDLLHYKKALFKSSYVNEEKFLDEVFSAKPGKSVIPELNKRTNVTKKGGSSADLSQIFQVTKEISSSINKFKIIVTKTTVPVTTGDEIG